MDKKNEIKLSKFLSLLLRHNPAIIGLQLDANGWANVNELIAKSANKGKVFSFVDLKYIVENNDKQRYTFNEDETKIRANQGHSIEVELDLKPVEPPEILYHGTAIRNIDSIMQNGIHKGNRNHVHLSADIQTARKVGLRHGKVVILEIKAGKMVEDGIVFYLSENKVWLTAFVEPVYVKVVEE